ncbi:MAG TPA: hypothetical protein VJ945_06735 [Flavobacteriaceae bacterium]|nr:hypothetical protein [Flavobacteriaceae bacterium]
MKKIFLCIALTIFGLTAVNAQGFKLGANVGIPVGDASDYYNFNIALDVNFLWPTSGDFEFGLATGFSNGFGKDGADDAQFLPVAGAGRFNVSEDFLIGADIGYGIGINDGNDGGFYYRPMVGYNVSERTQLNVSYTGVSLDGWTWSTVNLGVMFAL